MRPITKSRLLSLSLVFTLVAAFPPTKPNDLKARATSCSSLSHSVSSLLQNTTVYTAQDYAAGTNFTVEGTSITNPVAFCRFGANVTTSARSAFQMELWMPHDWNGRFLMNGNGGDAGSVQYGNLLANMNTYGFATASTNGGHDLISASDGSFARNNTEAAIDFAYRSVHLTTTYSKTVISAYYGRKSSYNYFSSCSGGGRMAFKEAQMFPDDFEGIIAGAPAAWTPHLDGHQYWRNELVNKIGSAGYVSAAQFNAIYKEVLRQCDDLDGLHDLVITEPGRCKIDYTQLACGTTTSPNINANTCLNEAQMKTYLTLTQDWHSSETGELIFPTHNTGTENQLGQSDGGLPFGNTGGYFDYQVLNYTEYITPGTGNEAPVTINGVNITESQLESLIRLADEINPASTTAFDPNLKPYFSKGGKLIHYHGAADGNIPTGSSVIYRDRLISTLGDVSSNYRFYQVEGMQHCGNGVGPVNFGQNNANTPRVGDSKFDVIGAIIAWVEKKTAPAYLIGTMYTGSGGGMGPGGGPGGGSGSPPTPKIVNFTRPICPYPQVARYTGGNWTQWESFTCA